MVLLQNFGYDTRTDGSSTFTNREANAIVHGNRLVQFHSHPDVVTGHAHLSFDQVRGARHVRRTEVELGPISAEEWGVSTTFIFG